jgi:mRNA interferase HicA
MSALSGHSRNGHVKRGTLLRHLPRNGCYLKREGASHSLWSNPATGHVEAVPPLVEIADSLAKKICQALAVPEPGK